ncbi:hypothetical protein ACFX16_027945 [Malus domestica]
MMHCSTTACTMKLPLRVKLVQMGTRTSLMRQQKPWSRSVLCLEELIEVRILNSLYEAKVLPPLPNRNLESSNVSFPRGEDVDGSRGRFVLLSCGAVVVMLPL